MKGTEVMDVNKAEAYQPLSDNGGRGKQERRPAEHAPDATPEDDAGEARTETAAVELEGAAVGMTPEAQAAFDKLAAELEPLRRRLAAADARISELRAEAGRHAFLDLPNRREFQRELGYVIGHAGDMVPPPALALVHLEHAEAYRLHQGRTALDHLLMRACAAMAAAIGPSDAIGSIGGSDFGVILLLSAGETPAARADALRRALAAALPEEIVPWVAAAPLQPGTTPDAALEAADRALRAGA